ncbi:mitochondrial 54S ribosomal protein rml2 [Malassezia cuniculi]|uniref:Large ribosomal subunit protein uL2m n=1 Tax=Malassezia cuniculi TaxID=948313 RepID=A0AAF0ERC2_9BASI|nr:mitochondrial 54S ribosomal protein rml2 [Malassezia cuniculi]
MATLFSAVRMARAARGSAPALVRAYSTPVRGRVAATVAVGTDGTPIPPPAPAQTKATRPFRRERRRAMKEQRKLAKRKRAEASIAAKLGVTERRVAPLVRTDHQFKTFKPITPSIRWVRHPLRTHLHRGRPVRSLTIAKRSTGGRNHHGHITVRGRGGGHRRRIRMVDFFRWETGEQEVVRLEYDPGRSAHIALIRHRASGRLSYILAPDGVSPGDVVQSFRKYKDEDGGSSSLDMGIFRTHAIRPGNVLPLRLIPIGTAIHAISLRPLGPAQLVRSAGTSGQLVAFSSYRKRAADREELPSASPSDGATHAQVKLSSGEVRYVPINCCATIGVVSNKDHQHRRLGKAGRSRWLGFRPKVRGVAMNAVDHPHGGGRGKSKSNKVPRSIYGYPLKFQRTRKPGTRGGNRMVIRERPRRNGKRAGKA